MPLRSRENITTHGELATGLTEDEQRGLQEIKEAGKNPELAEVLDKIDFARIEHIFKNQLKKPVFHLSKLTLSQKTEYYMFPKTC